MRIGFIGLGVMGSGMAANLVRKGHDVVVHNRSPAGMAPLVALGAKPAATLADMPADLEAVVLSLPATDDVRTVLLGPGGLAGRLRPGAVIIDTSTIDAAATRDIATALAGHSIDFLDAPVSGGQTGAVDGTLSCMVGGSEAALARCRPVFDAFATTLVHVGDVGAGQITKACNQICVAAAMMGAAEALALAVSMGVDPARVRAALLGGTAKSVVMERHVKKLLDGDLKPGFRATLMEKDLGIATTTLAASGVHAPVTGIARQTLAELVATGGADGDWIAVALLVQEKSGLATDRRP